MVGVTLATRSAMNQSAFMHGSFWVFRENGVPWPSRNGLSSRVGKFSKDPCHQKGAIVDGHSKDCWRVTKAHNSPMSSPIMATPDIFQSVGGRNIARLNHKWSAYLGPNEEQFLGLQPTNWINLIIYLSNL